MKNFSCQTLLLLATISLGVVIGLPALFYLAHPHEVTGAVMTVGSGLWFGLQVIFFLVIGLSLWGAVVFTIKHLREVKRDTPAVFYKGSVHKLGGPHMEADDQVKLMKEQLQFVSTLITTANKWNKSEIGMIDADVPDSPALPPPREDESLNILVNDPMHADDVLSKRKFFTGAPGSGKSNLTAVTVEELGGRLDAPLVLLDTEDEYQSLNNRLWLPHGMLVGANSGRYALNAENAYQFGQYILDNNLQVVLNLQSYEPEEAALIMVDLIEGLRAWEEAYSNDLRAPCEVILEEASYWLPQNVKESSIYGTEALRLMQGTFFDQVRRGRKRGLGLTIVTQKAQEIDKRALNSDMKLLLRQTEEPSLKLYRTMGVLPDEARNLKNGEAFLISPKLKEGKKRVMIRERKSPDNAKTPGLSNLRKYQQGQVNAGVDDLERSQTEVENDELKVAVNDDGPPVAAPFLSVVPSPRVAQERARPRPQVKRSRKPSFNDAVDVWNEVEEVRGRRTLRTELLNRGFECGDDLAKTLMREIRTQLGEPPDDDDE